MRIGSVMREQQRFFLFCFKYSIIEWGNRGLSNEQDDIMHRVKCISSNLKIYQVSSNLKIYQACMSILNLGANM